MSFVYGEDEEAVRATAAKFAREKLPVAHLRALRDAKDAVGFSRERWREWAELGLAGAVVDEKFGGGGLGFAPFALAVEECGRTLAPLPWLSALLVADALRLGGSDEQRRAHLPALARGEKIFAFAHDEGTRHARTVATRAERAPGGGFTLHGDKVMVLDGHVADALVVSARVDDGVGLFWVNMGTGGLHVERMHLVDHRNAARVHLHGVQVREADAIGPAIGSGGAASLIDALLDRATVALAAEMLGGAAEVFERTVAYLKTRKQFGVPIGSFQALQHRAATAYVELELLRAVVREAAVAVDEQRDDVPKLACAAKARAADVFGLCAAEAVQMHGGIGVTDDLEIGFYYKRARVAAELFGDAAWQRDRYARLEGY